MLGTTLQQRAKMNTILKSPKGLKDLECKRGQLSNLPPIPYDRDHQGIPRKPKIKLPDGTIFNMSIFSQGITEEYLAHVVTVLCLINQKGLNVECRKLAKAVGRLAGTLENLQKLTGPKGATSKEDQESSKLEILQTQEMLQEAHKAHNKAVAKTYKLLTKLLSGDPQSQWDQVCCKMHKRDSLAEVNGQTTTGRHLHSWTAFQDCLKLHKLAVFTADKAKRQRFFIQQAVHQP